MRPYLYTLYKQQERIYTCSHFDGAGLHTEYIEEGSGSRVIGRCL